MKKGFTLIELMVFMAITLALSFLGINSMMELRKSFELTNAYNETLTAVKDLRNFAKNAVNSEELSTGNRIRYFMLDFYNSGEYGFVTYKCLKSGNFFIDECEEITNYSEKRTHIEYRIDCEGAIGFETITTDMKLLKDDNLEDGDLCTVEIKHRFSNRNPRKITFNLDYNNFDEKKSQ